MEFLSAPWWSALLAIILIDLVLAGDNAIVIALAARSLPADLQKKAIFWGTVGAIAVRGVMTIGVVWLLQIPGLMLASLFMLVHDDSVRFPFFLALGLLAGWLVKRYRSLLPAVLLHVANNIIAVVLLT